MQVPEDEDGTFPIMRHGTCQLRRDVRRRFKEGGFVKKTDDYVEAEENAMAPGRLPFESMSHDSGRAVDGRRAMAKPRVESHQTIH